MVLVGPVTEQCVPCSALDAYLRHHGVTVPHEATAHIHRELADAALQVMRRNMRASIVAGRHAVRAADSGLCSFRE